MKFGHKMHFQFSIPHFTFALAALAGCVSGEGPGSASSASEANLNSIPPISGGMEEVVHDGKLVGLSLFDGKVLVNGNVSGSAKSRTLTDTGTLPRTLPRSITSISPK